MTGGSALGALPDAAELRRALLDHGVHHRTVAGHERGQRIELLATTGGNKKLAFDALPLWQSHRAEVRLAVWCRELPSVAQILAAVLK